MNSSKKVGRRFLSNVQHWMEHRPIVANSVLCFTLWVAGDSLAQYSEHRIIHGLDNNNKSIDRESYAKEAPNDINNDTKDNINAKSASKASWSLDKLDLVRTAQCASYGAFVTGPLIAVWYPLLERFTKRSNPLSKYPLWGGPVFKVILDQFVMDPPTIVAFYGYMNICEGGTMKTFHQKLKDEFLRSWLTSLAVWPIVLLGTFRFLPIYAHAPVINACAIVWDGFLSHRNAATRIAEKKARFIQEIEEDEATESRTDASKRTVLADM